MAALFVMVVVPVQPATVGASDDAPAGASATIAVVGDVILGGSTNAVAAERGPDYLWDGLQPLMDADLSIANLESVATARGVRHVEKSEVVPYYFRARPETLAVLAAGGIDAVATANNHSGDYGLAAILEQNALLDEMGIARVGTGNSRAEACAPVYLSAGDGLRVALFSADATEPHFSARSGRAGTCHLPLGDRDAWDDEFADAITHAERSSHAVLFAVHWGENWQSEPSADKRSIGRLLIDLGVDAVLGSNAHTLQGIELHAEGVIVHDVAHAVAPFGQPADAAIFTFTVSANGLESVAIDPIIADTDRARSATPDESARILARLTELSAKLGASLDADRLDFRPDPRPAAPLVPDEVVEPTSGELPPPAEAPPPDCVVDAVPEAARIEPIRVGPLTLVGAMAAQDHYLIPALIQFDTYWMIDAPVATDLQLVPHGIRDGRESALWMSAHEPCDWGWPTSRWKVGTIYRDEAALRPPPAALSPQGAATVASGFGGPLSVSVGVERHGSEVGRSPVLGEIDLGVPALLTYAVVISASILLLGGVFAVSRRRRLSRERRRTT